MTITRAQAPACAPVPRTAPRARCAPRHHVSRPTTPRPSLVRVPYTQGFGLIRYVMCEELRYNGQRRRDVPDLASGTLYIDVGDRATRRKRHSFHHELWHMVDFHLLGALLTPLLPTPPQPWRP